MSVTSVTSDAWRNGRAPFVIIAIVFGILIGVALGLYAAYVVLPADLVMRDASPRYLRTGAADGSVQYRDLYIARVAQRYKSIGGASDPAFQEALDSLGVTRGDATPAQALQMVRDAQQTAQVENQSDGANPDAGRFQLSDFDNMKALGDRLETIKDQGTVVPQIVVDARRNALIFGLLAVLLLSLFLLGLLFLLSGLFGQAGTVRPIPATVVRTSGQPSVTYVPPARVGELRDDVVVAPAAPVVATAAMTEPGTPYAASVAGSASPVVGEVFINQFTTAYHHGHEIDEDFQISAPTGELIGECGASIAHRYGMDVVSKVVALSVWVFDKNDFQSTSKVLVTPFALSLETIQRELASKGDLVQARPGLFEVVTSQLRVEVEVRNLTLKPIENDPDGYFDSVDLDFRVFRRM
jgi:hypothetical protein